MTIAQRIVALFGVVVDERVLTAAAIIETLGIKQSSAYTVLKRLVSDGELIRARYGQYHLPGVTPPPDLKSAANGPYRRLKALEDRVAALEARLS